MPKNKFNAKNKRLVGAGEMAQRLRAPATLVEALGSTPSAHVRELTPTYNNSSRGPSALSGLYRHFDHTYTHMHIDTYILTRHIHTY